MSEEFIRGVDEDLRHKQLTGLWKKFGPYVIAFLIVTVLFVAGNVTLNNYNESNYAKVAKQYAEAEQAVQANDMEQAQKNMAAIANTNVVGYQLLIAFKQADIELGQGDPIKAVASLDRLARASDVDKVYRDLASLKAAMILLDSASYDEIKMRLAPLTVENNPWKYMAMELLASSAMTDGNIEEAKRIFTSMEQDLEAPQDVKARAKNYKSVME